MLDERFLSRPSFAIEQCKTLVNQMAEITRESFLEAMECVNTRSADQIADVIAKENRVDVYEDKISAYLTKLNSGDIYTYKSSTTSLLHCLTDFERISDHAVNVVECVEQMEKDQAMFSKKAQEEMATYSAALKDILNRTTTSFVDGNLALGTFRGTS